jgi:hypothetical protein
MPDFDNTNKGVAFKNDYKTEDKHPYYKGKGNFNGVDFDIAVWKRTSAKGDFLSIAFSEPYVKKDDMWPTKETVTDTKSGYEKAKEAADKLRNETDDDSPIDLNDIPF